MSSDTSAQVFIRDLAERLQTPVAGTLTALYRIARADDIPDPMAVLNPGCIDRELDEAETRIGHALHPLHRLLLHESNGGTVPFVGSLSLLAGAIQREQEWRIIGPFLSQEEEQTRVVLSYRTSHSLSPFILGESLRSQFGDVEADAHNLDLFIVFASGFSGDRWGYMSNDPCRIYHYIPRFGRGLAYQDFAQFIGDQMLYGKCATAHFLDRIHAALNEL